VLYYLSWKGAPVWGTRPDFYYCQIIAGFLMWGALSNERTGLSFTIAPGLASAVIFGSESHGTRDHILLSQIRDFPFRRLGLAGIRWRYRPRLHTGMNYVSLYNLVRTGNRASTERFVCCIVRIRCHGNVLPQETYIVWEWTILVVRLSDTLVVLQTCVSKPLPRN
jgi:hypothetical protein